MAQRAKQPATKPIVELHIELEYIEPIIWRRVHIPTSITLAKLHHVIQDAMGWTDSHLHEFVIDEQHYGVPDEEDDLLPYQVHSEKRAKLDDALMGRRHFDYLYDFGDHWEHKLRIERRLPDAVLGHPVCVSGANACPPEDVGSWPGYEDFLQIIRDPTSPEYESTLEWCGGSFDPAGFDIDQVNRLLQHIKL